MFFADAISNEIAKIRSVFPTRKLAYSTENVCACVRAFLHKCRRNMESATWNLGETSIIFFSFARYSDFENNRENNKFFSLFRWESIYPSYFFQVTLISETDRFRKSLIKSSSSVSDLMYTFGKMDAHWKRAFRNRHYMEFIQRQLCLREAILIPSRDLKLINTEPQGCKR